MKEASQLIKPRQKQVRHLEQPDFIYKGFLYSDGITDQGVKVIPKNNNLAQNADSKFKQCLFRIEIKQSCDVNKRARELAKEKLRTEDELRKLVNEFGGEDNVN